MSFSKLQEIARAVLALRRGIKGERAITFESWRENVMDRCLDSVSTHVNFYEKGDISDPVAYFFRLCVLVCESHVEGTTLMEVFNIFVAVYPDSFGTDKNRHLVMGALIMNGVHEMAWNVTEERGYLLSDTVDRVLNGEVVTREDLSKLMGPDGHTHTEPIMTVADLDYL